MWAWNRHARTSALGEAAFFAHQIISALLRGIAIGCGVRRADQYLSKELPAEFRDT